MPLSPEISHDQQQPDMRWTWSTQDQALTSPEGTVTLPRQMAQFFSHPTLLRFFLNSYLESQGGVLYNSLLEQEGTGPHRHTDQHNMLVPVGNGTATSHPRSGAEGEGPEVQTYTGPCVQG